MKRINKIFKRATTVTLLTFLVSCGGTTNNDQGASFLALGYYADSAGSVGRSGDIVQLFSDTPGVITDSAGDRLDGLQTWTFIGLQNNLTKQFVRLVRIDCDYSISGSFIRVPSSSYAGSAVIGAAPSAATDAGGADGGQTSTVTRNILYYGFQVISPDIYSFLNNNKASLPELPFRMNVICSATGVTQAGDVLTTNPLNYFIQFVEEAEVGAGSGPGVGVGSGGTLVTTGAGGSALIPDSSNVSSTSEDTATAIDQEVVTVNEDGSITTTNVSGISVTSTESVN